MKNSALITAIITTVCFISCKKDFLEQKKLITLTEESVFTDSARTLNFVSSIYADINFSGKPDRWTGGCGLMTASDEADPSNNPGFFVDRIIAGAMNSSNVDKDLWTVPYQNFRRANIFLKNLQRMPISASLKNRLTGEVRFLRAWYYFILLEHVGGVPVIGDTVYNLEDKIDLPRNTFEETLNYILQECDEAAGQLPNNYFGSPDYGRITKGACLALKSRALLYAASPLFNGGGIAADAALKVITGYPSADQERWKKASDAAEAVISFGQYNLITDNTTAPGYGFYKTFTQRQNNEFILQYMRGLNKYFENMWDMPSRGGTPKAFPYQGTVDAFGMKNGLPISDPASGYNAADPYTNREPRFYYSIIFNGALRARNGFTGEQPVYTYLNSGLDQYPNATFSGYYVYKMIDKIAITQGGNNTERCEPLIRYAEILLNAAEARNEYSGPDARVYDLLKLIRNRAGISPGTDGLYGLRSNMGKEEMRLAIRQERRTELAFEGGHRFWDVRRWKIADQTDNKLMNGMEVTKNVNGTFSYKTVGVKNHVFTPAMYLFPIPQSEVTKSPAMRQNPGY